MSLGNRGSQILMQVGPFTDYTRLFAATDATPPTPIFQTTTALPSVAHRVASAEETDVHATFHLEYTDATLSARHLVLRSYSSSGLAWSYAFPFTLTGIPFFDLEVSADGQRIVAAAYNGSTGKTDVAVFRPTSSTPIAYVPVATNGGGFDLSSDGKRVLLTAGSRIVVLDLDTQQVVYNALTFNVTPTALAISADGTVFAYASYTGNTVYVYARTQAGAYVQQYSYSRPGTAYCIEMAVADDDSALACGYYDPSQKNVVRVEVHNLPQSLQQGAVSFLSTHTISVPAGTDDNVTNLDFSVDGQRLAVGTWGDGPGPLAEAFVFERGSATPLASVSLPGSVMDLDLSGDGRMLAVASKAAHATTFVSGGQVQFYKVGSQDFGMQGVPHHGDWVQFDLRGAPNSPAFLIYTDRLSSAPFVYAGAGALYLDQPSLRTLYAGMTDASGLAHVNLRLDSASDPLHAMFSIGSSAYFQGLLTDPRRFTDDWLKCTVLP